MAAQLPGTSAGTSASIDDSTMRVVFLLGPPGVGKGTLCKVLASDQDIQHLSTGDHLRKLCDDPKLFTSADYGGLSCIALKKHMDARTLVPAANIVRIIDRVLTQASGDGYKLVLLDGFPRHLASAERFDQQSISPCAVLNLQCPRHVAKDRFMRRKRSDDDTEAIFDKRYDEFEENNQHILEHYADIVQNVDMSGDLSESLAGLHKTLMDRIMRPEQL